MNLLKQVVDFLELAKEEPQLGPTHISLYLSIVFVCYQQGEDIRGTAKRKCLMNHAKIFSVSTYHKCMKELCALGYVRYKPSFDPLKGSIIWLRKISI
ncbi:MAG: hypothetical protein QM802_03290 [Agriterribacter sp.]